MAELGTILTAMVTPMEAGGAVSPQNAAALMRHLVDHGSDGLVICGTTGESPTLDDAEKLTLFELAVAEVGGRATVIAGTGSNDTAHVVELTRKAGELGVDAMLIVCPYYNKPPERGIYEHFKAAAAATDKPVILYNIPGRCVINMSSELIAELAQIENIVGVKQANDDLQQARAIIETGLDLYAGDDNLLLPFLELGGKGGVCTSSQIVGERMQAVVEAFLGGDTERARQLDRELQPLYEGLFAAPNPILIKAGLELLGHDVGGVRLPLVEASESERETLRALFEQHGLLTPAAAG